MRQPKLFETGMDKGADFSPCRTWRYALWRTWDDTLPVIAFCCLNCSSADEKVDDPTVRRCITFSRDWGAGSFIMLNAYAFRSTDPRGLKSAADPVGPNNDKALEYWASRASQIVVAWGVHIEPHRAERVLKIFDREVFCLGVNNDGTPKHPLYIKRSAERIPYRLGMQVEVSR